MRGKGKREAACSVLREFGLNKGKCGARNAALRAARSGFSARCPLGLPPTEISSIVIMWSTAIARRAAVTTLRRGGGGGGFGASRSAASLHSLPPRWSTGAVGRLVDGSHGDSSPTAAHARWLTTAAAAAEARAGEAAVGGGGGSNRRKRDGGGSRGGGGGDKAGSGVGGANGADDGTDGDDESESESNAGAGGWVEGVYDTEEAKAELLGE